MAAASDSWLTLACTEGVPRRSLMVAIVVGTVLNLINQGDVLLGAADLNVAKLMLTYMVPYLVATYGAVASRRATLKAARRHGTSVR